MTNYFWRLEVYRADERDDDDAKPISTHKGFGSMADFQRGAAEVILDLTDDEALEISLESVQVREPAA